MASSNRQPKCCVCKTPFKYGDLGPYLLPCLHSVCQSCYDGSEDIQCYVCDESYSRGGKDLLNLPKDAVATKDIFLAAVENKSSELLCENRVDGNQAMCWCEVCEAFLCEHCQVSHEDMKATKSHKVMSLQDISSRSKTVGRSLYCDSHCDHPYTFYDKTCKIPICAMCALGRHNKCTREELDVTCSNLLASLEDKKNALSVRQDSLLTEQSANKQHHYELVEKQQQLEEIITHTFDQLQVVLRQREREVKIQLVQCFDTLKLSNEEQHRHLDSEFGKHKAANDFIQKCLKMADPIDLLAMKQIIDERSAACIEKDIPMVRSQEEAVGFSRHGLQELTETIAAFGTFFTARGTYGSDILLRVRDESGSIILRRPAILMSKERLNTNVVHIDMRGFLVHGKDFESQEGGPKSLETYSGTVSNEPLTTFDLQYWEVKVNLELLQELGNLLLFEIGVSVRDAFEHNSTVSGEHNTFVMFATLCDIHNSLCVKSRKHGRDTKCLTQVMTNNVGAKAELHFGFAYNPRNKTLAYLDINAQELLGVSDNMDVSNEYWPVFAVYNGGDATIEMKLICGSDITVDATKKKILEKSLY